MTGNRKSVFTLFLLLSVRLFSQDHFADSLNALINADKQDTLRVCHLIDLSEHYKKTDIQKSFDAALKATELAKTLGYERGICRGYQYQGFAYQLHGDYTTALAHFQQGIDYVTGHNIYVIGLANLYSRLGNAQVNLGKTSDAIAAFQKAEKIADSLKVCLSGSEIYRASGAAYSSIGEYSIATEKYLKSLDYSRQCGDVESIGFAYVVLANNYQAQNDFERAMEDFRKSLSCFVKAKSDYGIAGAYISLGNCWYFKRNYDSASYYYRLCLDKHRALGDPQGIAQASEDLANVILEKGDYQQALALYVDGLSQFRKLGDSSGVAASLNNIGSAYKRLKDFKNSEFFYLAGLHLSEAKKYNNWIKDGYEGISDMYAQMGDYKSAFLYKDSLQKINDVLLGEQHSAESKEMEAKYENRKQQEEIKNLNEISAEKDKVEQKQKQIIIAVSTGLGLVLILALLLIRTSRQRRRANMQLASQNKLIAEKNKDITDSITYARRIQRSVLPDGKTMWALFSDHFLFYRPRDIVSGDFYWAMRKGDKTWLAVADCTGHGVPGALVSVVGINLLNKIMEAEGNHSPSDVLGILHSMMKNSLHRDNAGASSKDGMDIALVCIDRKARKIIFSGACRPFYYSDKDGFHVVKGDRFSIAGEKPDSEQYIQSEISYEPGTEFYLTTDGYADQFGETTGKKFMTKQMQDLLASLRGKNMKEQAAEVERTYVEWKGASEQVDDVCVIGVKL